MNADSAPACNRTGESRYDITGASGALRASPRAGGLPIIRPAQPIETGRIMPVKQRALDPHEALRQKERCAEVAHRHHGWMIWVAGTTPVATRAGSPRPPADADATGWARTLVGDGTDPWADLERQLDQQP